MRAILLILIVAVVALIAAVETGFVHLRQTSPAVAPSVAASDGRLTTTPGQAPRFDVETGSVGIGTKAKRVAIPVIEVKRDGATVAVPSVEVRTPGTAPTANSAK